MPASTASYQRLPQAWSDHMDLEVKQLLSRAEFVFANFQQGNGTAHIDEAIVFDRQALNFCPSGHPIRWDSLTLLALHLRCRYNHLGEIMDIEEAISVSREALYLLPEELRSTSLNDVASGLLDRYKQLGEMGDLNGAMAHGQQALSRQPPGHPDRPRSLNIIANCLCSRFNQLGDMADLNKAIVLERQALDLRLPAHPDCSASLTDLAICLFNRFNQLGKMADLNEAIVLGRQALKLRPPGHPDRPTSLNIVANCLSNRFNHLGEMMDINRAIVLGRQALRLRPPGHPHRSMSLNNVASYLSIRYDKLREMADLDEAIVLGRQALQLRPPGHPHRSMLLNNIAIYLSNRYDRLREVADLNEAIFLGQQALALCPPGHPDRSRSLHNVAVYLANLYDQLGELTDLDEAIVLQRQALDLCPSGHPDRSWLLDRLACCLRIRFTQWGEPRDIEDLFILCAQLAHVPQIVSSSDLFAARRWVRVAEHFSHSTTLLAYETSLRLLTQHLATLPSLPQHLHIFKNLASSLAVDAFSACLRNQSTRKAVELLEQGRGVFWSQISCLRSPLEDVVASGPAGKSLADEFTRLTSHIQSVIISHGPDQHDRLCGLNINLQAVITKIRELPGLARFLLPSHFSDLQHAASGGPIIIVNASEYSCDVLVVFFDKNLTHIPLQITKSRVQDLSSELQLLTLRAKTMDVKRDLGHFLRQLWDEVVSPIADFLLTALPVHARIWWCPTAEFSHLPLHAAGPYRQGQRNLSDLYISSYTPTLTALIRARRNAPLAKSSMKRKRFLAVGQANADGEIALVSVHSELAIIDRCMQGLATFTRLAGPECCVSRVSEELRKNECAHFACHGLPNRKQPFESAFALYDGRFTVEHIIGCELENPEFAYLSACHTTVGDEESPDEVIHLASAMQFAGFRSVIGTMWAVDDGQTNKITSMFYSHMVDDSGSLDHTRAAFALNKTMNTLVDISLDQRILYVHIGA